MIIAFFIWSLCALLFLIIGIRCFMAKEAAGFFTHVSAPAIRDIKGYNHAVSMLWFISAALFEIMGFPFLFSEQNSPVFLLVVLAVVFLCIGMMIAYLRIEAKYKK